MGKHATGLRHMSMQTFLKPSPLGKQRAPFDCWLHPTLRFLFNFGFPISGDADINNMHSPSGAPNSINNNLSNAKIKIRIKSTGSLNRKGFGIEAIYEESTSGELEDRVDCRPSFYPAGKPEVPSLRAIKGSQ
jgi:hypothetical protein